MDKLLLAAKKMGRYGQRNYTLLLMMYRHGLRVSEAIALRWSQIDFKEGQIHVRRLKNGKPSVQRIPGVELRSLRLLKREWSESPYLFVSERGGGPLTDHAVRKLVARVGEAAAFDFPVHPHMLRHATGYYLASKGHDTRAIQDYLGHRNIHHTVRYTELAPGRFDDFWTD
jgi:integrase